VGEDSHRIRGPWAQRLYQRHAFTVIGVAAEFTGMNQFVRSDFFVPLMMSAPVVTDPSRSSKCDARNLTLKGAQRRSVAGASAD